MSKSRLEKFLYALYSLDSSDLPNTLSRIEELYKCLVTGDEAPTFKPLSRVEKYLMAILGAYDVENLPNPLSRVEVLLHKLAVGDDNLDDFKSFISEHEELLAEIIRNGGVGGNIDIEYVLYTLSTKHNTLYNTAEKPVKSAILKGSTLVNHKNDNVVISPELSNCYDYTLSGCKSNANYLIKFSAEHYEDVMIGFLIDPSTWSTTELKWVKPGNITVIVNSGSTPNYLRIRAKSCENLMIIEYQEAMENMDIPYFEGMQSVKMPVLKTTGKNLFDGKLGDGYLGDSTGQPVTSNKDKYTPSFIEIDSSKQYCLHVEADSHIGVVNAYYYDNYKNFLGVNRNIITGISTNSSVLFTPNYSDASYIRFRFFKAGGVDLLVDPKNIALYESSTIIDMYEPYKSNILTVNEEVELRGIGDVKDELDLTTGKLTQRIGEVVLNGSEGWKVLAPGRYYLKNILNNVNRPNPYNINFKCDKLKPIPYEEEYNGILGISLFENTNYDFIIRTGIQTLGEFEQWLSNNPTTVQYLLASESIKTVDLSVVDLDGNNTKLSTFNDITHVTLSSEGLIPEAELEVATKNEEDLGDSIAYTAHTLSEEFNTLYNTAEKPVKSAILKGNTLVNLQEKGTWTISGNLAYYAPAHKASVLKTDTKYIIYFTNLPSTAITCYFDSSIDNRSDILDNRYYIFTTKTNISRDYFIHIYTISGSSFTAEELANCHVMIIEYQDGMENWDIPYFEGMQSVKMPVLTTTGKNLFPTNNIIECRTDNKIVGQSVFEVYLKSGDYCGSYVHVDDSDENTMLRYELLDEQDNKVLGKGAVDRVFTIENDGLYKLKFSRGSMYNGVITKIRVQIEEGSTATPYEPFKSNILTVNEDVVLRGIGNVQDTLDLMTGELTERIGEVVLDGSETIIEWQNTNVIDGIKAFSLRNCADNNTTDVNSLSDTYITYRSSGKLNMANGEGVSITSNHCYLKILTSKLETSDIDGLKKYLSQNPITVQYELAEESVKTVDLSVVNQDGNDTKLSTFDDITHVTLSSEGLVPEAELEVAEKLTKVAASMLAISHEQEVIDTTTNEQSENVDATMIATTEIYEGLL